MLDGLEVLAALLGMSWEVWKVEIFALVDYESQELSLVMIQPLSPLHLAMRNDSIIHGLVYSACIICIFDNKCW